MEVQTRLCPYSLLFITRTISDKGVYFGSEFENQAHLGKEGMLAGT